MKPKYNLKKNFLYAVDGLKELSNEMAFRIESMFFIIFTIVLFILPYPIWAKIFMFASLFIPLLIEALNTAIEKVVDLVSPEYHILAKHAKDIAASAVMLSIFMTIVIWLGFIVYFKYTL